MGEYVPGPVAHCSLRASPGLAGSSPLLRTVRLLAAMFAALPPDLRTDSPNGRIRSGPGCQLLSPSIARARRVESSPSHCPSLRDIVLNAVAHCQDGLAEPA